MVIAGLVKAFISSLVFFGAKIKRSIICILLLLIFSVTPAHGKRPIEAQFDDIGGYSYDDGSIFLFLGLLIFFGVSIYFICKKHGDGDDDALAVAMWGSLILTIITGIVVNWL